MEIGLRTVGMIGKIINFILWPILYLLSLRRKVSIPPIKNEILLTSAINLAEKIRKRQLASEEVVTAFIDRCKVVNPYINAIVQDRYEEAVKEAKQVDIDLASNKMSYEELKTLKPLLGIPVTVKESCGVKGMSFCVGNWKRKGLISEDDGAAVRRLREAGAIPIAVTNTPELCLSWETDNLITGRTNNPYNEYRTCGGSSGGEAALLAAGASVIGLGSDFAGSIRIPSMFCGIYGHKATPGCVPPEGHFPYSEETVRFMSIGPMTRYVEDLLPVFTILLGDKGKDLNIHEEPDIGSINILFKLDAGFSFVALPVDSEIKEKMLTAIHYLSKTYNCNIERAQFDELQDGVEICTSVFLEIKGIQTLFEDGRDHNMSFLELSWELIKSIFGFGKVSLSGVMFVLLRKVNAFIPKKKYPEYYRQAEELKYKFCKALGTNGVFLYPTYPIPAFHHGEYLTKSAGIVYTMICNILDLPSTHVPMGLHSNGLPIGIQVIAGRGQDRLCLAVAKALEKKFGGWVPPSSQTY